MKLDCKYYKGLEVNNFIALNIFSITNKDGTFDSCFVEARIPEENSSFGYALSLYVIEDFSSTKKAEKFITRLMEVRDSKNPPNTFDASKEAALIEAQVDEEE